MLEEMLGDKSESLVYKFKGAIKKVTITLTRFAFTEVDIKSLECQRRTTPIVLGVKISSEGIPLDWTRLMV